MLSLRAASIHSPSSLFISDRVLLTVKLDLVNGGVRHGGEISVDLTTSSACYRFHYHHIFHWLTLIHNWLSDGEIKSLIHLGEYHHLCIQSTISELPTILQSGPWETHQKQNYSQHRCLIFSVYQFYWKFFREMFKTHFVSAKKCFRCIKVSSLTWNGTCQC